MEDEVVELVVAVNNPQPRLLLVRQVRAVPSHKLLEIRDIPDRPLRVEVDNGGLSVGHARQGFYLTREVV
jgi:hypothetical protein